MEFIKEWLLSGFDTPKAVAAQILGIIPIFISIFLYAQNTRKKIVFAKASMDICLAIHLILLEAYTGALLNIVVTIRNILFLKKDKMGKWKNPILVAFGIFVVLCAIPDFAGIKSLFPVTGSLFALIGFWQEDVKKLRIYNLIGTSLWLVYSIWEVSVSSVVVGVFSIISIFAGFIRSAKNNG